MFLDFPLDVFGPADGDVPDGTGPRRRVARPRRRRAAGGDDRRRPSARRSSSAATSTGTARGTALAAAAEHLGVPCFFNGLGSRHACRPDHELAFLRTRGLLKQRADLVVVVGTPLDFRVGFGRFGDAAGRPRRRRTRRRSRRTSRSRRSPATSRTILGALADHRGDRVDHDRLDRRAASRRGRRAAADRGAAARRRRRPDQADPDLRRAAQACSTATPWSICDGGDFVSYAGKYVEVHQPGCWLDTGPYGCLGNGIGLRDRGAGRCVPIGQIVRAARRRRRRLHADGRRLARAPRPAGRDDRRQQRHLGPREAPDAGIYGWDVACDLQPGTPLRRGREGARRRRRDGRAAPTRSGRRSTGPSPAACPYLVNV